MNYKVKCGICNRFVKAIPVENPRVKGEVDYICKEHGVINNYIKN